MDTLRRIMAWEWPRRYPIAQFPNAPLLVALVAAIVERLTSRGVTLWAEAVGYLALAIWAYDELARGVNAFRRVLGATALIATVVGVAKRLGA